MIVPYLSDCILLRATGRALGLPLAVIATGLVYLHRCRRSDAPQPWALSSHDLVCGCLYTAAKAEEAQVSTNQAINAAHLLALPENAHLLKALVPLAHLVPPRPERLLATIDSGCSGGATPAAANAPAQTDKTKSQVLVGDAYYAAKEQLFVAEQHVLRHNHFVVHVEHPYKHALHMAHTLLRGDGDGDGCRTSSGARRNSSGGGGGGGADGGNGGCTGVDITSVVRCAVCMLHDVLTATVMWDSEPPEALAAGALVAAMQLLGSPPLPLLQQASDETHRDHHVLVARDTPSVGGQSERLVAATGLQPAVVGRLASAMLCLVHESVAAHGAFNAVDGSLTFKVVGPVADSTFSQECDASRAS